eukprot:CAMPEP_0118656870 /NCGR_PEP_ID=MMETSP0785-20121206/13710_1 /TAXON_ID=91992 /ORGANISM="Bolidomonas pacifica, Strain CCMP 1866" /LENGTH=323 /DNA_ID=CAMNT_0006549739 /DNA_START=190 /DNA_END=1158 /DNA_ORIENTATION=+
MSYAPSSNSLSNSSSTTRSTPTYAIVAATVLVTALTTAALTTWYVQRQNDGNGHVNNGNGVNNVDGAYNNGNNSNTNNNGAGSVQGVREDNNKEEQAPQPPNESSSTTSSISLPTSTPSIPTDLPLLITTTPQETETPRVLDSKNITLAYTTTTGTSSSLVSNMLSRIHSLEGITDPSSSPINVVKLSDIDWWDELLNGPNPGKSSNDRKTTPILVIVIPTWTGGNATDEGAGLLEGLNEIKTDWRVDRNFLKHKLKYCVYGVGSSAYDAETFCKPAVEVDEVMRYLGATPIAGVGKGDVETGDIEMEFEIWSKKVVEKIGYS